MVQIASKLYRRILLYLIAIGTMGLVATLIYEWYFNKWIDNGADYFDNIVGVKKTNHYRARGRKHETKGKQGYWVYWRPGPKHTAEVVQWYGELKSRRIISYPGQGNKLKEGYYRDNKKNGFWVFWSKTMQVDRKLTGLYRNDKLVRNALRESFPKPEAGHPFDNVHALLRGIVWSVLVVIMLLLGVLWIFTGINQRSKRHSEK